MAKLRITFKDPDGVFDSLDEYKEAHGESDKIDEIVDKYVQWGEYVTIEFDTESGTAKVVPVER